MKKEIPSPSAIYYRLLFHADSIREEVYVLNPFGNGKAESGTDIFLREITQEKKVDDDKFEELEKEQLKRIVQDGPWKSKDAFSTEVTEMFSHILVDKRAFDIGAVSDFIKRLDVRDKLNEVSTNIALRPFCSRASLHIHGVAPVSPE